MARGPELYRPGEEMTELEIRRFLAKTAFAFGIVLGFLIGLICGARGWLP